ncbi:MAG TPA: type II toxin-antitoxin system antitoxin SocA domain-containing protein [Puia sp.]|jgi:putative zinc finger/helix-turn-helix YgiT family protein|nr:type II toxin-antitoxin system antitoxin SocA domain-containing protein [Puia sp.]
MKSPHTGKAMKLLKEKKTLEFRKESFEIIYHYYKCEDTGEEFVDEEIGDLNLDQVYNAYRAKHKLPFTEEIKRIRSQYDLPATTLSEVLGLGVNQYRLYEGGDIPSETNARLIQLAADPDEFLRLVELSGAVEGRQKEKLLKRIADLKASSNPWDVAMERMLGVNMPSEFNGFRRTRPEKAYHMIRFFADSLNPLKTALNKLLFYADFYHFKRFGVGISGLSYRAIQWGPVPSQFDYLFKMAEENGVICLRYEVWDNDKEMVVIDPSEDITFRDDLFTLEEISSLESVLEKFKPIKTRQLVDISHQEPAWKENIEGKKIISYQYAFDLLAI